MANRRLHQFFYTTHAMPVLLDCNFIVDNSTGAGLSSLKGPGIAAVYMHTTGSPVAGSPNPAAGTIVVQLQDNYNRVFSGGWCISSPLSGSDLKIDNSALTAGVAYVISILGNSTAAAWHTLGVPAGITPAVGVAFIAASVGAGANTSTSRVEISAAAGSSVASIEIVGQSNLAINPQPTYSQSYGAQIILQCRDYAGALVAPAALSLISLQFLLSNSSVVVQGE